MRRAEQINQSCTGETPGCHEEPHREVRRITAIVSDCAAVGDEITIENSVIASAPTAELRARSEGMVRPKTLEKVKCKSARVRRGKKQLRKGGLS